MAKINLLPWRAERRKQKQKEFGTMLGIAAVIAAGLSFLIVMYYNGQIRGQENRNAYLTTEIATIDKQLVEIESLDKKKADLLSRKQAIECLQGQRSLMVHLFDDLVRTIPDGVKLNGIEQKGNKLTLNGSSQSNARVSAYMRNLQVSGWMGQPELTIIEARGGDKGLPYQFTLIATIRNPNTTSEDKVTNVTAGVTPAAPAAATAATPAVASAQSSDDSATDNCQVETSTSGEGA